MSTPAELLKGLGYEAPEIEWQVTSDPPIEPARFGKDHYSTLLYVEGRAVDYKGMLDHDQMRCDSSRHPVLSAAKRRGIVVGIPDRKYPTRLLDGEQADHDDYDCLDDMLAAGWLTVTLPVERDGAFRDAFGHAVRAGARIPGGRGSGEVIEPGFVTGMSEAWLGACASWGLTEKGFEITAALRKHKAEGGTYATFRLPEEVSNG